MKTKLIFQVYYLPWVVSRQKVVSEAHSIDVYDATQFFINNSFYFFSDTKGFIPISEKPKYNDLGIVKISIEI